jgi:hypothetical protein
MTKDPSNQAKTRAAVFQGHLIYEQYSAALPKHTKLIDERLSRIKIVFRELFKDENFLSRLEAEGIPAIPACLEPLLEEARCGHEIL